MAIKPELLVAKKGMLVAMYIVTSLVTISVAILSLGMAIRILHVCLGYACMQPCKSKRLNWPFLHFSGGLL